MNILVSSHAFYPDIGGIESVSEILTAYFATAGHNVRIVTQTSGPNPPGWSIDVVRNPGYRQLIQLARWCDLYWHNNISLQSAWPLIGVRRPWVITHQTWIPKVRTRSGWREYLKRFVLRFATNVSISNAVAATLPCSSHCVGNPFHDELFRILPGAVRDRELLFLGRLVSDKGVDLLLLAVAHLRNSGRVVRLTIAGSGPEEPLLRSQVSQLALNDQVQFLGFQNGEALVKLLNRHKILVMPSRWNEPFGIAALEGIGCGCIVVGSSGGGLPEAIGPCGITFRNGDWLDMAAKLCRLLEDERYIARLRKTGPAHLQKYTVRAIGDSYLSLFDSLV